MIDRLRKHEVGHVDIAEQVAEEFTGGTISAIGDTREQARRNLQEAINDHADDVEDELQVRDDEYDELTQHGAKQSILGGEDVTLDCPSP
jgi:predicted secreted Zn-dependent protease